jgi:cell division septation protein DedD
LIEQRKEIVNNKIKMTHVIKESVSVVGIAEQTARIEKVQAALGASSARAASLAERTAALLEPVKGTTSVGTMPLYETTSKRNEALITSAPKHPGAYFKIQIVAMKRFDFEEKIYDPIRGMGRADMEYIVKKDMVRVLLADFFKREDAQKLLPEIRKNREFSGAFIVQYTDGVRH